MSIRAKAGEIVTQLCPPILLPWLKTAYRWGRSASASISKPDNQNLDVYWDVSDGRVAGDLGRGKRLE